MNTPTAPGPVNHTPPVTDAVMTLRSLPPLIGVHTAATLLRVCQGVGHGAQLGVAPDERCVAARVGRARAPRSRGAVRAGSNQVDACCYGVATTRQTRAVASRSSRRTT